MKYSIIIPVYNRPDEIAELLDSLSRLSPCVEPYEIIVVEDGSTIPCEQVVRGYEAVEPVRYLRKENSGPGPARNFGAAQAKGEWLIFLDSDTIIPSGWLCAIDRSLSAVREDWKCNFAAFGGPDRASADFSPMQKAISYSMTSFLTTGGIRGGKRKITRFFPRSFNMAVRADVFREMGSFAAMRFGEDMDLSMRIVEAGYRTTLVEDAWVFHKRRSDLPKFWRQVFNSGRARIELSRRHPGSLKLVHLFPLCFVAASVLVLPFDLLFCLLVLADSTIAQIKDGQGFPSAFAIGLMSVAASYVQLWGYGLGFVSALFSKSAVSGNIDNERFYN